MTEERIREIIFEELSNFIRQNRYYFNKPLVIADGRNIYLGKTTGTKIGMSSDDKIGFFGQTPVTKPAAVSHPSGGSVVDTQARDAIIAVINRLTNIGLLS